ncbi:hypothetical protein GGX14DRAFT_651553 [Mycena pura]|uniref:NAD(P)-binding protein n=1 Tax=Mycena pura TaxID=153505 RepID=A0AAD6V5R3_9AGAR|nr:hypothetical protein GGX14DRAFT_651553 [Mycena pura]
MAEGFARYVGGRAHIITVGRNEHAAADIIARFPTPATGGEEWTHELVPCDSVDELGKETGDAIKPVTDLLLVDLTSFSETMAHQPYWTIRPRSFLPFFASSDPSCSRSGPMALPHPISPHASRSAGIGENWEEGGRATRRRPYRRVPPSKHVKQQDPKRIVTALCRHPRRSPGRSIDHAVDEVYGNEMVTGLQDRSIDRPPYEQNVLIRAKVRRVNFLVITAGYGSMVNVAITTEGLDMHLAMLYYQRFVFIEELLPLVQAAHVLGQDAKIMSVLSAGRGSPSRPLDLANLGNTIKQCTGRFTVALRSIIMSSGYTDAMLAHFAARNSGIAFTHIHPGIVRTHALHADFDGLLTPLSWLLNWLVPLFAVSQDECAEHMLYALFTGARGLFIRDRYGNVVSTKEFDAPVELGDSEETSVLDGTPMPGYGASDRGVHAVVAHTEAVTAVRSSRADRQHTLRENSKDM